MSLDHFGTNWSRTSQLSFLFAIPPGSFLVLVCRLCLGHSDNVSVFFSSFLVHLSLGSAATLTDNFGDLESVQLLTCALLFNLLPLSYQFTWSHTCTHTHRHASPMTTHWEASGGDAILTSRHKKNNRGSACSDHLISPEHPKLIGLLSKLQTEREVWKAYRN